MKEITTLDGWQDALSHSKETPVFVLKHSTTCPVSAAAYHAFEDVDMGFPKYIVKVQNSRPISNQIEQDLGVRHESPQLLVIRDEKSVWDASHYKITTASLRQIVETLS